MSNIIALFFIFGFATMPIQASSLLNIDLEGIGIKGYDPVAYFTEGKPEKGVRKINSTTNGVTYLFATPAHKKLFDSDPVKYEPEFGGFCAYGVSDRGRETSAPVQ
jgi:YHS domain-containing protein